MAFNDIEKKRYDNLVKEFISKRRPPVEMRSQVDLCHRIEGNSIEIFEIRARWNKPNEKVEVPVAKTTFVKKNNVWKIFWQRSDLKWHAYPPAPEVKNLEEFLEIVDIDQNGCFWG